jgi:hypothetical protein
VPQQLSENFEATLKEESTEEKDKSHEETKQEDAATEPAKADTVETADARDW